MGSRRESYSSEYRELAVRLVREERAKGLPESAAIRVVHETLRRPSPETLKRWVARADRDESVRQPDPAWRKFAKNSVFRTAAGVGAVAVAVLTALTVPYTQHLLGLDHGQPDLHVDQVTLTAPAVLPQNSNSHSTITPFKIDIRLLNDGTQLAAINNARLVIQQFAVIPQCNSQGGFASTGSYDANMPINPRPGSVVNIGISQLVDAGGADRFDLRLQTPLRAGEGVAAIYLYRINIYLQYNSDNRSINAGEVLVTLPVQLVNGEAFFWTRYFAGHPAYLSFLGSGLASVKRCLIKNSRNINAILSMPAIRTPGVAALRSQLAY